jgi:hypothetical protein
MGRLHAIGLIKTTDRKICKEISLYTKKKSAFMTADFRMRTLRTSAKTTNP